MSVSESVLSMYYFLFKQGHVISADMTKLFICKSFRLHVNINQNKESTALQVCSEAQWCFGLNNRYV